MKEELNKEMLERLYVKQVKTIREVAEILDCSREAVRRWCKKYGIPLRPTGVKRVNIDESTLRRLHIQEGKSFTEIAKIFNCTVTTVTLKAEKYGIKNIIMRRK